MFDNLCKSWPRESQQCINRLKSKQTSYRVLNTILIKVLYERCGSWPQKCYGDGYSTGWLRHFIATRRYEFFNFRSAEARSGTPDNRRLTSDMWSDVCCQTSDLIHHISHIRRLSSDLKHLLFDVRIWCQTFDERWQTSDVWYMFDVRCQTSNVYVWCLISDVWHQASQIGHRRLDIRCLTLGIWYLTYEIRRLTSDIIHITH